MLDSLLKRIFRRQVEKKVEQKVEREVEKVVDAALSGSKPASAASTATATPTAPAAVQNAQSSVEEQDEWDIDYNHDIDYFRPILQQNFPEYTIEENVPFAQIVPGLKSYYPPYTFVMRKNGAIALIISLQSKYKYKKGLHTYCEWKAQLRHINFFIEYPDHPDYVVTYYKTVLLK